MKCSPKSSELTADLEKLYAIISKYDKYFASKIKFGSKQKVKHNNELDYRTLLGIILSNNSFFFHRTIEWLWLKGTLKIT